MRRARVTLIRRVELLLIAIFPAALSAQDTSAVLSAAPARHAVACTGQRVNDIIIRSSAPTVAALRAVPVLADVARSLHTTTRPDLIRRYLLMSRGDICTELRRSESERILRAQPFLADASVQAFPNDSGSVDLEVRTLDETATIVGATLTSASPFVTAALLGSSNLGGAGMYLVGNWHHDDRFREGFGLKFTDYQFGALPYILNVEAQRDPIGDHWQIRTAYPFLTDLQRTAWSIRVGNNHDYVFFSPNEDEQHAIGFERRYFDIGGVARVGPPGRLNLFGASVSGEAESVGDAPILITPTVILADTTTAFVGRYESHRIARLNALWGIRDIGFVRVRGFDALTATQDLPVGFQLGTEFGRSVSALGANEQDLYLSGDLYAGVATENMAVRLQLQGEGRRSQDTGLWDGVVTAGRLAHYFKVSPNQTQIASFEWSSGWRMRIPFALTLGATRDGVRGYSDDLRPGAQRAILRLEQRYLVGQPFGIGDAGLAVFSDVGRLWAGDIPFGQSTPLRASAGFSVLASVPTRSARLWRLDVALPLNPAGPRRLEFRITSSDRTTFFWREPDDIARARERTAPSSIFNWP